MRTQVQSKLWYCLLLSLTFLTPVSQAAIKSGEVQKLLGYEVSTGAAAGYLNDKVCQSCHPLHWQGYQEVGMSKSFLKPNKENSIENFKAEVFFHQASQNYYKIEQHGDDLLFKRYQLDNKGNKINEFQQKIDWILGSGHKSRSYLYQNKVGEIYQLPLGWYTQTQQWFMSPGYEQKNHSGVLRAVRRECLFCHNAFPQVASGSDSHWQAHVFPHELPHGTGCQRCHGPGAKHIKTVTQGGNIESIKAAIINPAKLPAKQRDSVCFQCHMLPAVAVIGVRKFDRTDYSFRPGELISDYMLHVDIDDANRKKSERFEINHHAYRLTQSECFIKSAGKLSCISCHNPHKKIKAQERIQHYGAVCLSCHSKHKVTSGNNPDDCMACHMPQRRTQDVVHVLMTDHKIQKITASQKQRLAPIKAQEPAIQDIKLLNSDGLLSKQEQEIYTTVSLLRTITTTDVVNHLQHLLEKHTDFNSLVYLDLAKGQIDKKQFDAALKSLKKVLKHYPQDVKALQLSGLVYSASKKYKQAEQTLKQALKINNKSVDSHFNLALLYLVQKRYALAKMSIETAIELRPNMVKAWYYAGYLATLDHQWITAEYDFKTVLKIDPTNHRSYLSLVKVLMQQDKQEEAQRYLNHGIKVCDNKASLQQLALKIMPQGFE
jgi:Tfp pilus assembly protein PilF